MDLAGAYIYAIWITVFPDRKSEDDNDNGEKREADNIEDN